MFNRRIGMAALASAAVAYSSILTDVLPAAPGLDHKIGVTRYRPTRKPKGQQNRRGRGVLAKPRKRTNMLRVSKRVRRKHRRTK